MALLYLGVMILLEIAGYDVVNDATFPIFLGSIFSVVSGVMKVWRSVSR